MSAQDLLVGQIVEGADSRLEQGTATSGGGNDDHSQLRIEKGQNDTLDTGLDPNDALDENGNIVPGSTPLLLESASALAGDDVIRGTIQMGADGVLNSRPANANDVVMGVIQQGADGVLDSRPANANDEVHGSIFEGADSNLQSRPADPTDYVDGYMDPGPGPDAHFDPRRNNDRTSNLNPGFPVQRPDDDQFDSGRMVIHTGGDGLCSTTPSGDDEPHIAVGDGEPDAICVSAPAIVVAVPNTDAAGNQTRAGADDGYTGNGAPNNPNQSINEHQDLRINVGLFQAYSGPGFGPDGIAGNGDDQAVDLRDAAHGGGPGNDAARRSWISKTIVHEAGHGMHGEHHRPLDTAAGGLAAGTIVYSFTTTPFPNRNPGDVDALRSDIWQQTAPAPQYDDVSRDQIRLHLKHNP